MSSRPEKVLDLADRFDNPSAPALSLHTASEEKPEEAPPGICALCTNYPDCTFPKPEGGVRFCDELDYPGQPKDVENVNQPVYWGRFGFSDRRAGQEPENLAGLCPSCENRFECRFPKPEGGVWHCEEFI